MAEISEECGSWKNRGIDELWELGEEEKLLSETSSSTTIYVLELKDSYSYTIPSFSVISVSLRHAVVQMHDDSLDDLDLGIFDIFFRGDICLSLPTPLSVEALETCLVNIDEFSQQILIPNIRLVSNAVYVVWKWKMKSQVQINTLEPTDEEENYNEEDNEEEKEISVSDSAEDESYETVTFKCIGATREISFQTALRTASSRIRNQDYVPVRLTPEPNNIYDSKAIAFECQLGGKWEKIGYVIKELLDIVHDAIESKEIVKVEFSWIKYITDWRRSGPGYFAGISISKNSRWDKTVLKYSSTR